MHVFTCRRVQIIFKNGPNVEKKDKHIQNQLAGKKGMAILLQRKKIYHAVSQLTAGTL